MYCAPENTSENRQSRDDDADADALDEIVMAVDMRERGTVGCAYYLAREGKLYFMEDVKLGGVETVENCWETSVSPIFNHH
jgi:DNA mismatch repair protein MSH5